MSDGTKYHRDSMTCAHKRYPLGTLLKVTNLTNGKSVVVKVTDRGPHTRGRIVDLSYAAAKQINMIASGVVMVKVEVYKENAGVPYRNEEEDNETVDYGSISPFVRHRIRGEAQGRECNDDANWFE